MAQILIIEDNDDLRNVLQEMLEKHNYVVMVASDGEEGLKLFRENPVPLVITDIVMPNKEGIETIFDLQRDFPEVNIIAISGGGQLGGGSYLETARGVPNVKKTFMKPFGMDELLQAVRELLDTGA
jgi:DNA-binding response OmpR family regulator